MTTVPDGESLGLRWADGAEAGISLSVTNAPGIWGNATGDPMLDTCLFAPNGSNMVVTLRRLPAGRYQLALYGWAAALALRLRTR